MKKIEELKKFVDNTKHVMYDFLTKEIGMSHDDAGKAVYDK